ncbi:tetratricopeptide repeat protein [Flavobacteriaceae bacterium R38]|nr:tetratricopeptide repeat protein [Flavobacteriaceae bacterium R38]
MRTLLILFFIYFLCSFQFIYSQNQTKIDSLKRALSSHQTEDSTRVEILTLLHEKLMFSEPEAAKKYAEEELRISQKIDYQEGIGRGFLHLANYFENRNNTDSTLFYYNKAKGVFEQEQNYRGIVFVNYSIADFERAGGNYANAIAILEENLQLIDAYEKNPEGRIKFSGAQHNGLALIYLNKGSTKLALMEALKALKLFEEINDILRKADMLKLLGDIEYQLENYIESVKYYDDAIRVYKAENDVFYQAHALNSAGKALKELQNIPKAKAYQTEAIQLSKSVSSQGSLAFALCDLGELSIMEERFDNARNYFLESLQISKQEDIKTSIISAFQGLAKVDRLSGDNRAALNNINKGISIAEDIGAKSNLSSLYGERSKIYENLNMLRQAMVNLRNSQKINDSLFSAKKVQQIEELSTIYETEKKEAALVLQEEEIKTLNANAENDKLTKTLYGGGAVTGIALSGLLFFGFRQRMKKNKIAREKQEEIYKQEIAFKQKELASQTLHLVQKNTFLQDLKENLEKLKNSPEKFKVEFRRIVMLLKKESTTDKDWEVFKSYFSEVHDNFDNKLKAINSSISEKDLRLASFIKMNLSTKEIAAILNVLPQSVLTSKYRLKKKLGIDKETDVYNFLMKI